jgi:hypothetical protein
MKIKLRFTSCGSCDVAAGPLSMVSSFSDICARSFFSGTVKKRRATQASISRPTERKRGK